MLDIIHHFFLIIQILFGLFVVYLILRIVQFKPKKKDVDESELVSIIIPFRNEAHNLTTLLNSLKNQNYRGPIEIILVNDQSTDNFKEYINSFQRENRQINLSQIDNDFDPARALTSKQQALDKGVSAASGTWLAFTDADMRLDRDWISTLVQSADNNTSLVYGHTVLSKESSSFFTHFQAFQLEFLFATAYAFHAAGLRGSCMGNNLLIRTEVYKKIGGQAGIGYSIVEDRDLLNAVAQQGFRASPTTPFVPTAETKPCTSFGQFFHQILRWVKGGIRPNSMVSPIMALFALQHVIFILLLIFYLPCSLFWGSIINAFLLGLFLRLAFRKIASSESLLFYPLFLGISVLETVSMLIPTLFFTPLWKERKV